VFAQTAKIPLFEPSIEILIAFTQIRALLDFLDHGGDLFNVLNAARRAYEVELELRNLRNGW
jgi:hypothetical protein